jgi:hypothetical protein
MQLGLGLTASAPFSRGVAIGSRPDDAGWIVLGSASVDDGSSAALAAGFDPTGNLDPGYAVGGSLRHQVGGPMAFIPTSASGGAIDADGSAFLTGGTDGKLVLVKVTATGQYEASYVGDFSETAAAGSGGNDAFVTPAGTLVAGWTNDENGQQQVLLVRFTAALALDPTFGGGTGFARLQIADPHTPTRESVGSAVAVGPANEIYVAGRASDAAGMAVMRFSSSGIPRCGVRFRWHPPRADGPRGRRVPRQRHRRPARRASPRRRHQQ